MISVPYKSAFGNFTRSNAAELSPDGEVKTADLSFRSEEPVDMTRTPTASSSRSLPSLRSEAPAEDSVPVEVREAEDAGTELPDAPAADEAPTAFPAVEPPITDEEIEEMFEEETHFEDDPPSKAQKVKAGLAVAGSLGLLYFIAKKALG